MIRTAVFLLIIILMLCVVHTGAQAQVCGNVNDDPDGRINIADITWLFAYLSGIAPPPNNMQTADIDDHTGVAPPDAVFFVRFIFGGLYGPTLDCTPTQTYSYLVSTDDTIFIPRMIGIPDGVDEITLPVAASAAANTIGFYAPIIMNGPGSSDNFSYKSATKVDIDGVISSFPGNTDTTVLLVSATAANLPAERTTYYSVTMKRDQAGVGSVMAEGVDFSAEWPLCVIKEDFNMYTPVIQYVDIRGYSVELSVAQLNFTSVLDFPPPDVIHTVEISSPADPINWSATYNASWLNVDFLSGTTPSSINVTIDPSGLDAGLYVDTISFVDDDYAAGSPVALPVYLTVKAPFPSMDANCDGNFNISDLAYIINYLFGIPTGPPPCDPCTGTFPNGE